MKTSKVTECFSCDFLTKCEKIPGGTFRFNHKEDEWLCNVCNNSQAGIAAFFPEQHQNLDVLRMIAYVTNLILQKIK